MTFLEAQTYLIENKLNGTYTDYAAGFNALFSVAEIKSEIDAANRRAWDYRRWAFTLEVLKLTYSGPASGEYYIDYPNTFVDESIGKLRVNGLEWDKRNFDDYQKYFAENPSATDKYWSNYKRQWFANKNSLSNGDEIAVEGKLKASKLSASSDLLAFSPDYDDNEDSGNIAICRLAYAALLGSSKLKEYAQSANEEKAALAILDSLWAPMAARESREQSINRPFFDTPDFFAGRNSRPQNTGNFF